MRRLILLRHGKAKSVSATGGDFDRGLTDRGRRDCALIGRVLAEAGLIVDLALVSAARRTRETWEDVAHAFPAAQEQVVRGLYLASPEQIWATIETVGPGLGVMVVGHNPGLHELALTLAGDSATPGLESFPTAAAAVFNLDAAGGPSLERVFLARDHGGGPT